MSKIIALLLAAAACVSAALAVNVHPMVWEDLERAQLTSEASPASFLVYMRDQANLAAMHSESAASNSRDLFGAMMVEELQSAADNSQQRLLQFLRANDLVTRVASLYVVNAVVVDCLNGKVLNEILAQFSDEIEHVEPNRPFIVNLVHAERSAAATRRLFMQSSEIAATADVINSKQQNVTTAGVNAPQWNIDWVKAPYVWELSGQGEGTIYANADTGVLWRHETLIDNYKGQKAAGGDVDHNYAWFDGVKRALSRGTGPCGIDSQEPCDDNGHGTHTTSTAVGAKGYGVAPKAQWIACRNMDRGLGSSETYLNCLQFFLAPTDLAGMNPDPSVRPHAIGNSYGCPAMEGCARNAFSRAVATLRAAGIFMSVSAGNEGPGCSTVDSPPAYEPLVVSVGATSERSPRITSFSSRGPAFPAGRRSGGASARKPDVTAPGQRILAAIPNSRGSLNSYRALSGTSMASPHVGGAVLLLTEACPSLSRDVDALQELLQDTADHYTTGASATRAAACGNDRSDSVPNNVYGYGGINLQRAVDACRQGSRMN